MQSPMLDSEFLNSLVVDFDQIKPLGICQDHDLWSWWNDVDFFHSNNNTMDYYYYYYDNYTIPSTPTTPTTEISNDNMSTVSNNSNSIMVSSPLSTTSSQEDSPLLLGTDNSYFISPLLEKKPHKCSFCSRSFTRRHDLDRHTRIHTGVKPYPCPCCQKAFARSDARGRHFQSDPTCSKDNQVKKLLKTKKRHLH